MATPFRYPKSKHVRTQNPPSFRNYRQYKPFLKQEFSARCVYCLALEALKGNETFGVDHYRPKKHFPHLETEYLNLLYACNRCNSAKGDFWPTPELQKIGCWIPNLCEHVMFDHLRFRDGEVVGVSLPGEWTIEKLLLNDPTVIRFRRDVVQALTALHAQLVEAKATTEAIQSKLQKAQTTMAKAGLSKLLAKSQGNLGRISETILSYGG